MCGSLEEKRGQEGLQAGVGVEKRIRAVLIPRCITSVQLEQTRKVYCLPEQDKRCRGDAEKDPNRRWEQIPVGGTSGNK